MFSILSAFMSGFLLAFGLATEILQFMWGSLVCAGVALLLRWCEIQEGR